MAINTDAVQRLYVAYFNRPSDPIGQAYWESKLPATAATQAQLTTLAAGFSGSAEYAALYAGQSNAQIVNNLYLNLFGRSAEPAGLTSWANALTAGTQTFASIALQLTYSAQGTDATAIANKLAAANAFTTALDTTAEITGYSGTAAAASARTWLATVTDVASTLTAATATATLNTAVTSATAAGTSSTGTTFTLTTAIDTVTGTANNDTILGDFTATSTLNAGDQITGGAGTDTLKMFGTYDSTKMPITVTGVEVLDVVVAADAALDFSSWTKAVTGVEKVIVENATLMSGKTITTTAGQSLSLATGATSAVTAGTITWAGSATDTSLSLTLNGYQAIAGGTPAALTVTGAAATTLNIASTGGANKTGAFTGPTTVTSHVITGDQKLTYAVAAADAAALNSINASATTGGVSADVSAAANKIGFTFSGGTGNDTVKFANNQFGTLTSGTQITGGAGTGDKIGILDTALSTAEATAINATTGFEVLGLNAAITLDASTLTSIKQFSIDTTALTQTISNLATGSTITLNAAAPTALTLAGAIGVSDATINLGTSSTTGNTVTTTLTTTGLTAIALTSNGSGTSTNTITTLANADNSTFTVTGSADLIITNALAGTTTGTSFNASGMTGKLTVIGSTKADIIKGGTGDDTIQGAVKNTAGMADTLTGGAGADTFKFIATGTNTQATDDATLRTLSAGTTAIVKITDFTAGTDKIHLEIDNTAGTLVSGTSMTVATAQTISTAADLTAVYAGITQIAASTSGGALSSVVLTVSAGAAAGTYLYINDNTAAVSNTADMLINITGVSGTIASGDFVFA